MKKLKSVGPSAGSRILASLQEAVDWVEGPVIDVKAIRRGLGLSQAAFTARFGFQAATLRNWEQGLTQPDGPARVLLAVNFLTIMYSLLRQRLL